MRSYRWIASSEVGAMGAVAFRGRVRRWDESKPGGLAVIDVPPDLVERLGGRRQYRVAGTVNGAPYRGSSMLVAGGGFAVGVSQAALAAAGAGVGDDVDVDIDRT
jgi:hypothetical protein